MMSMVELMMSLAILNTPIAELIMSLVVLIKSLAVFSNPGQTYLL